MVNESKNKINLVSLVGRAQTDQLPIHLPLTAHFSASKYVLLMQRPVGGFCGRRGGRQSPQASGFCEQGGYRSPCSRLSCFERAPGKDAGEKMIG